mgnify:FL=1
MIATIDLGNVQRINSIETRFLQSQIFWIFLPKKIQIEHSINGTDFDLLYEISPDNDFSFVQDIFTYIVEPQNMESRFIRLKALNIDQCPKYHPGAGKPSWIFSDEIVIN